MFNKEQSHINSIPVCCLPGFGKYYAQIILFLRAKVNSVIYINWLCKAVFRTFESLEIMTGVLEI